MWQVAPPPLQVINFFQVTLNKDNISENMGYYPFKCVAMILF